MKFVNTAGPNTFISMSAWETKTKVCDWVRKNIDIKTRPKKNDMRSNYSTRREQSEQSEPQEQHPAHRTIMDYFNR